MPGYVNLVKAISDDVVAQLAAAGYPPLVESKILLGRQYLNQQGGAPRIVFVPLGSEFQDKDQDFSPDVGTVASIRQQAQEPSIAKEWKIFEVHVWGVAVPADPDQDYDATEVYRDAVLQTCHRICSGRWSAKGGKWDDKTLMIAFGRHYVFYLKLDTPVLGALPAAQPQLPGAPSDVHQQGTVQIDLGDGSPPEVAATNI